MLVLVSFGLVLLATILLVVGLLSDGGLGLIYLSILASIAAGVVLYFAWRRARPTEEGLSEAPEPLAVPAEPTTAMPAVTAPPVPTPAAVAAAPAASGSEWSSSAAVDDDFPIADYDDLTVAEILPLLPQLYSDELDVVIARERAGKGRSTILNRLEQLAESGTEADAIEAAEQVAPAPVAEAPAVAPVAARTAVSFADDDDEDFFPIADYDELTVAQILPLLPKLELDELEDVRSREAAGDARTELLTQIDRYLSGELEVVGYRPEDDTPAEVPAAAPAKRAAAKKAPAKRAPAKKAAAKKAATKKAAVKKAAPVKKAATATKAAAKKAVTKKAAPVKKAAAKKAPAKKAPAKKAATKKAATKRA